MRIAQSEAKIIKEAASAVFGAHVAVWLFGSRAGDSKKGGALTSISSCRRKIIAMRKKCVSGVS